MLLVLFADDAGPRPESDYASDAFGFYWTEGRGGLGWAQDATPTLKGGSTIGIPSPPTDSDLIQSNRDRKPGGLVGWWPDDAAGERWSTANASLATRQGNNEHAVAAIHRAWRNEPGSRWELHGDEGPRQIGDATIRVLAPLQTTIDHSKTIAEPDYNEMSSAMLVTWGDCDILLGADLINARGWNSLEAIHGPGAFSQTQGMKVAHHGSKEAQHVVALGNPPPTDRTYLATPYNRGRKVPDYRDGGDVDLLLTVMHRLLMAGHHGPMPSTAADGDISRRALAPQLLPAGPLVVELDAVRPPISNCWVASRWARDGSLLGTERGAGSLSVVA